MPLKKRKPKMLKPRHVWGINPKTRVKPSVKLYRRTRGENLPEESENNGN